MKLILDSHLDLAYNAIEFNRDLRQPVAAIRQSEANIKGKGRGSNTVSLHALREGNIGLCFATVHSRVESMEGKFPGVRTQEIAYAKAQGELAFYRALEQQGAMRMIRNAEGLDTHLTEWQTNPAKTPIGFVLSMEGADPIMSPAQVPEWWEQGLRTVIFKQFGLRAPLTA